MGLSFTEFSYQLVQGADYLHLYREKNCKLQMGGSDQWGNIMTGTELIRRKERGEAFALTCPLITKSDGGKFGKTESGNVWLDPSQTTPYKFYQFWLNVSDADAEKYIKIFTLLNKEEVAALVKEQDAAPHLRPLQKHLAKEVTCMVHDEDEYNKAVEASQILFGNATTESLASLDKETFLSVFEGVPTYEIDREKLAAGVPIVELLATETAAFPSKSELRRTIKGSGLSLNKAKLTDQEYLVTETDLINGSYLLVQKGKKNYYIIEAV
jgi:tyrosyl-tRNA synthetase